MSPLSEGEYTSVKMGDHSRKEDVCHGLPCLEQVANALGAADPHTPIYPLISQIAKDVADVQLSSAFVPLPRHTRYVSPSWALSGVVPLPAGYYTSIAAAYASILAETPVPLATDKYQIILNEGHYAETVFLVSNVNLIGTDKDGVFLDGPVAYHVGSGVNAAAFNLDEDTSIENLTMTNGLLGDVAVGKNPALLASLRLDHVNCRATTLFRAGIQTTVKQSVLANGWNADGVGTTTLILNSACDGGWTFAATNGSNSYIFDTIYSPTALSTDATSGIDREYTYIPAAAVLAAPGGPIAIPVRYVNPIYFVTVTGLDTAAPASFAVGAKAVDSVVVSASAATTADILLTIPQEAL